MNSQLIQQDSKKMNDNSKNGNAPEDNQQENNVNSQDLFEKDLIISNDVEKLILQTQEPQKEIKIDFDDEYDNPEDEEDNEEDEEEEEEDSDIIHNNINQMIANSAANYNSNNIISQSNIHNPNDTHLNNIPNTISFDINKFFNSFSMHMGINNSNNTNNAQYSSNQINISNFSVNPVNEINEKGNQKNKNEKKQGKRISQSQDKEIKKQRKPRNKTNVKRKKKSPYDDNEIIKELKNEEDTVAVNKLLNITYENSLWNHSRGPFVTKQQYEKENEGYYYKNLKDYYDIRKLNIEDIKETVFRILFAYRWQDEVKELFDIDPKINLDNIIKDLDYTKYSNIKSKIDSIENHFNIIKKENIIKNENNKEDDNKEENNIKNENDNKDVNEKEKLTNEQINLYLHEINKYEFTELFVHQFLFLCVSNSLDTPLECKFIYAIMQKTGKYLINPDDYVSIDKLLKEYEQLPPSEKKKYEDIHEKISKKLKEASKWKKQTGLYLYKHMKSQEFNDFIKKNNINKDKQFNSMTFGSKGWKHETRLSQFNFNRIVINMKIKRERILETVKLQKVDKRKKIDNAEEMFRDIVMDCNKIRISELKDKYWDIFKKHCEPLIECLKMIGKRNYLAFQFLENGTERGTMYLRGIKHVPDEDYDNIMSKFFKPNKNNNNNIPLQNDNYNMADNKFDNYSNILESYDINNNENKINKNVGININNNKERKIKKKKYRHKKHKNNNYSSKEEQDADEALNKSIDLNEDNEIKEKKIKRSRRRGFQRKLYATNNRTRKLNPKYCKKPEDLSVFAQFMKANKGKFDSDSKEVGFIKGHQLYSILTEEEKENLKKSNEEEKKEIDILKNTFEYRLSKLPEISLERKNLDEDLEKFLGNKRKHDN